MACPKCGCKVHYQYDSGWDGDQVDENLERCAACGEVFEQHDDDCECLCHQWRDDDDYMG